ncbi:hypothetical protein [Arthrobacter sp. SD76]|uniref:hypothetical protein n=1 Tax=Arthrobacter sp. SD76 TaxID=3415007 RepID=UPI003C7579BC
MKAPQIVTEVRLKQNWSHLTTGQRITVAEPGLQPYSATLEEVMTDHSVLWVIAESGHQRKAFDHREGVVITPL